MEPDARPGGRPRVARYLFWSALAALAFVLNLGWEYAQSPLYGSHGSGHDLPTWIYLRATTFDAVVIGVVTGVSLLVRTRWRAGFWVVMIVALTAIAVAVELQALLTGRWSYGPAMPTIGLVGLSPLVQLPLLGVISNLVVRPWRAGH